MTTHARFHPARAHRLALLLPLGLAPFGLPPFASTSRAASPTIPLAPFPAIPLAPPAVAPGPTVVHDRVAEHLTVRRMGLNVLAGHPARIAGRLWPAQAGAAVSLQALRGRSWRNTARARTGSLGRFVLRYVPGHDLSEPVRLRFAGNAVGRAARRRLGWLNAYRPVEASWYSGGGGLACGGVLSSTTMGVASRTLPCGTEVTLRYGARTVRVPVVDRGPYVEGREFDLTEATKRALGFGDLGIVWSTR